MSMITATAWVPRGRAARVPTKYDIDEDELARISELARIQLDDAREDYEEAKADGETVVPSMGVGDGDDGSDTENGSPQANGGAVRGDGGKEKKKSKGKVMAAKSDACVLPMRLSGWID